MKIAYFGDEYSHTFACAASLFTDAAFTGKTTVRAALESVKAGEADLCVVPIENSVEGTVTETLDGICEKSLYIVGETVRPIHQHLAAKAGAKIEDIRTVYSHPQALSQCRQYLERYLPAARCEAVAYTSMGLTLLTTPDRAAVARTVPEGCVLLAENIEDSPHNATRFVTVAGKPRFSGDKASVMFGTPNRPGELLQALTVLRDQNLNMTKIESRPQKAGLGGYVFYVDFLFDGSRAALDNLLSALQEKTVHLKFLGQYDSAK